jgi:hypothetical protein
MSSASELDTLPLDQPSTSTLHTPADDLKKRVYSSPSLLPLAIRILDRLHELIQLPDLLIYNHRHKSASVYPESKI